MLHYAILGTSDLCGRYRAAIEAAGSELTAVCSRDRARAEAFGGPGVSAYDDLDELLRNDAVEAVYVCLPNSLHADAAERCLRAGKHVLCEKPAATSMAELERVMLTAELEDRVFLEGVMNFHSPAIGPLREAVLRDRPMSARLDYSQRSGKLDRIRAGGTAPAFDRSLGGGVLNDLGVYPLHFAVNLFGAPLGVTASARFLRGVDVSDVLTLRYPDFDAVVTVSKTCQSVLGSEILCDRATYTFQNLSVLLGAVRHCGETAEELDCGITPEAWPVADPSKLPGVQSRVLNAFERYTAGEDLADYRRLREETVVVQRLLDEAHRQISY